MNAHQIADQIRLIENSVESGNLHPSDGMRMIRSMWALAGTHGVDEELHEILNWSRQIVEPPRRSSCSRVRSECASPAPERGWHWDPPPPPQKKERSLQDLVRILNSYS